MSKLSPKGALPKIRRAKEDARRSGGEKTEESALSIEEQETQKERAVSIEEQETQKERAVGKIIGTVGVVPLPSTAPTEGVPEEKDDKTRNFPSLEGQSKEKVATPEPVSVEAIDTSKIPSAQKFVPPKIKLPALTTLNDKVPRPPVNTVLVEPPRRTTRPLSRRITRQQAISLALLLLLVASVVTPFSIAGGYGISGYTTYQNVRTHAYSGMQHLLNLKSIFSSGGAGSLKIFEKDRLLRARSELAAARKDFLQVQTSLNSSLVVHTLTDYFPQYRPQVTTVRAASQIGIDVADVGERLVSSALILSPRFQGPLLAQKNTPLITSTDIDLVGKTIDQILPKLVDIQEQSRNLTLEVLPLSVQQRATAQEYIKLLPQMNGVLHGAREVLEPAKWLLGVDHPRTFLVQTMDRGELRATGGFTGQYGELSINSGRIAPFSLRDISFVEYSDDSPTYGQYAPSPYRSWWPFANWGLRDSNLSADFPTSAKLAIERYKHEVNRDVDGVILLTPFFIEQILQVLGPLKIPQYNETITAQNLEEKLHYYQLDNKGILRIKIIEKENDSAVARKLFTSRVAQALMERVRNASPDELIALGLQTLNDLKKRDLQVYMTNPQVQDLLKKYGYAGEMDRSTTHDGFYIVQANVSASKASQFVRTTINDTVYLDARGGARHVMQMRLTYTQVGQVYGLSTYRDYVRIYVPPTAKLLWGNGFDQGEPLCGGPFGACPADGIYPNQELVCPTGQYFAGAASPMLGDPYVGQWHPLNKIGPPTNLRSDEPGRAMFAGYVVVPKDCTMTISLSWYVPPLSEQPYSLLVQRQSGTFPELNLTVLPSAQGCSAQQMPGLYSGGVLTQDTTFTLKNMPRTTDSKNTTRECTLQLPV
jgi:hypothetical protein